MAPILNTSPQCIFFRLTDNMGQQHRFSPLNHWVRCRLGQCLALSIPVLPCKTFGFKKTSYFALLTACATLTAGQKYIQSQDIFLTYFFFGFAEWWRSISYSLRADAGIGCIASVLYGGHLGSVQQTRSNQLVENLPNFQR